VLVSPVRIGLTLLSACSLLVIGAMMARHVSIRRLRERSWGGAGLVAVLGIIQFAGVFAVSANLLQGSWLSFDRYFLPVLPPLIVLGLLAIRDIRISPGLLTAGLAAFMLFSLAGTHDLLAFNERRWELAETMVARGISRDQIDAGMEWDGWFLYEPSLACCRTPRTPPEQHRPFWTEIIAQATDSTWVISSSPQQGFLIREQHAYGVWLGRERSVLYVLERAPPGSGPRYP
jgi:hypothetical protein